MPATTLPARPVAPPASATATAPARLSLAALSLAMLLASLDTSITHTALPALAAAFAAPFQTVQWVVVANLLVVTTLIVSVGRFGDRFGRRRLLLGGILLFTAAAMGSGLAPSLGWLIAARVAQGLGAAIMMALSLALIGETVHPTRTGRAMGLLGTMSAVGTALGPSLGGLLLAGLGWRAVFLIHVPLGLLGFQLARRHLPASRPAGPAVPTGFDATGTAVLMLTLTAYALALTLGRGSFGWLNLVLLLAAGLGAGLFWWVEQRARAPLVLPAMLHQRGLGIHLGSSVLVNTVVTSTLVIGPFYLSRGLGLDAARVGLVLSAGPLVAALTAGPAGQLTDRIGIRGTTLGGLVGMAAGCLLLALLPATLGVGGYIVPLVMITAGYGLFQTANNTVVMRDLPSDRRGAVSGLLNLSRNLGRITGAAALGAVFAAATSDVANASPAAVARGMQATFTVAGLLVILALLLASRAAQSPFD